MAANARPDVFVLDERGVPAVDVEVKARPSGSDEWANEYHRYLSDLGVFTAPIHVLLTRDRTFIWTKPGEGEGFAVIPTATLLGDILSSTGTDLGSVDPATLELTVAEWLGRLAISRGPNGVPAGGDQPAVQALAKSVRWGTVRYGALAA